MRTSWLRVSDAFEKSDERAWTEEASVADFSPVSVMAPDRAAFWRNRPEGRLATGLMLLAQSLPAKKEPAAS